MSDLMYVLVLDALDADLARFGDTPEFTVTRAQWEQMGKPSRISVTVSSDE